MSYQLRPSQPSSQPSSPQEVGSDEYNTYDHGRGLGRGYGQQAYAPPRQPDMIHARSQASSPTVSPQTASATLYNGDGPAHTQTWVINQTPLMSPPPGIKTPFNEWPTPTNGTYDYRTSRGYSPTMPLRPRTHERRICGIKRNTFFIVLAIGLFLLVIAVAAGLGVGLGTRKGSAVTGPPTGNLGAVSSSSSLPVPPASATPTATTPTATEVSPTPSFTGTLIPGPVLCPQNNNTVYVSQGSSKPFNVQCGRDYNSEGGAQDITHMYKAGMAQCIDACGQHAGCVGVGWGNVQGTTQCYLKSRLGEPNPSPNWYFAQLQDMSLAGA